jgi:hypothetical protein
VSEKPYATMPPSRLDEDDPPDEKTAPRVLFEERRGRYQDQMNANQGFIEQKTTALTIRDWGQTKGFIPEIEIREGTGLIVGGGYRSLDFGFRRVPYETQWAIVGMLSPISGRLGAQFMWDRHPENSQWGYSMLARGTQFEANRFYGFGNDSPELDVKSTLVLRDEVVVHPSLSYTFGPGYLSFGPIFKWNRAHPEEGGPADLEEPFGTTESVSQVGGHIEFGLNTAGTSALPRSGFVLNGGASTYPAALDIPESFHEVHAMAGTYLSFGAPVLALRVGGKHVWGDVYPLHESAFIGGSSTLHGYRWNRFAGDASAYAGTELRIPITRAVIFTRGMLGIHGLADVGRVWSRRDSADGDLVSPGDWHTGVGGGIWFQTIGQLISLSYAKSTEQGRLYFNLGAPF